MEAVLQRKLAYIRASICSKEITIYVEKTLDNIMSFSVYYRRTYLCVMAISTYDDNVQIERIIENINCLVTVVESLVIQGKVKYETL